MTMVTVPIPGTVYYRCWYWVGTKRASVQSGRRWWS